MNKQLTRQANTQLQEIQTQKDEILQKILEIYITQTQIQEEETLNKETRQQIDLTIEFHSHIYIMCHQKQKKLLKNEGSYEQP